MKGVLVSIGWVVLAVALVLLGGYAIALTIQSASSWSVVE